MINIVTLIYRETQVKKKKILRGEIESRRRKKVKSQLFLKRRAAGKKGNYQPIIRREGDSRKTLLRNFRQAPSHYRGGQKTEKKEMMIVSVNAQSLSESAFVYTPGLGLWRYEWMGGNFERILPALKMCSAGMKLSKERGVQSRPYARADLGIVFSFVSRLFG